MTFASREPFLMNWVSFHLPDKCFVFISWSLESLLTGIASKPQPKNPRLVKYRAENGPVLKQIDGNLIVESNLVLGLSQQEINLQSKGTTGHLKHSLLSLISKGALRPELTNIIIYTPFHLLTYGQGTI